MVKVEADWISRGVHLLEGLTAEEQSGRHAYAIRQASFLRQLKDSFKTLWGCKQTKEKDDVLADSVFVLSGTFSGAAELSGSDSSESEATDEEQSDCDMSS